MRKYTVKVQFEYISARSPIGLSKVRRSNFNLGDFDTIVQACDEANSKLELLERSFPLVEGVSEKERFTIKNGEIENLTITGSGYLNTPFRFFVLIRPTTV